MPKQIDVELTLDDVTSNIIKFLDSTRNVDCAHKGVVPSDGARYAMGISPDDEVGFFLDFVTKVGSKRQFVMFISAEDALYRWMTYLTEKAISEF